MTSYMERGSSAPPRLIKRMQMKLITTYIALMLCLSLAATTWEVKQDGSGHFTHIQDAIDAATHGDSIKVFPGTYVENIDYIGKNIFIYSLEYTTGNPAYRDSTIIDGNRNGSVVKSVIATTNCGIYGFTIQNGSGYSSISDLAHVYANGGGIIVKNSSNFTLDCCTIHNNQANTGGGVYIQNSSMNISGCDISSNFASSGGGVYVSSMGLVNFDQLLRSSIYNNAAGSGQDILAIDARCDMEIYLDMGSVDYSDDYFIKYMKNLNTIPGNLLIVDIQRAYINEIDSNLFVSPEGNDSNAGTSPAFPLKSIYRALQLVKSDSLAPNTVYLAPGDYSSSDNQFYPIGLKSYVRLQGSENTPTNLINHQYWITIRGSGIKNVIIDGLNLCHEGNPIMTDPMFLSKVQDVKVSNLKIERFAGSEGGITIGSNSHHYSYCSLKNVIISNNPSSRNPALYSSVVDLDIDHLLINNYHINGQSLDDTSSLLYFSGNNLKMSNSGIINSSVSDNNLHIVSIGIDGDEATRELKLDNVLVANNQTVGGSTVFMANFSDNPGIINNCTFAGNSGANYAVQLNGNFKVNNCIFDNDTSGEIRSAGSISQLQFYNNFIRNYPLSTSFEALGNVNFNEVVLTGEPGFCSSLASEPLSYLLANSSICRDMGTPDTLGLHLPATDLAGNPRIHGAAIDLGCYEWNHPVGLADELSPPLMELRSFPNPFSTQHILHFNLKATGYLKCDIYNVKGQKVRTLTDAYVSGGEQMLVWDGMDDSNTPVASGMYLYRVQSGKQQFSGKMVLAK